MKFYPFRVGSTGAYGPVTERIKLHCFFAKTIGTVPVFVGSVPFLPCRVNAPIGVYGPACRNSNVSLQVIGPYRFFDGSGPKCFCRVSGLYGILPL